MARKPRSEAGARAEADLRHWGFHVGKQYAASGYPSNSTLLTLLCGHSDLNPLDPKFGVNTIDIPDTAWAINMLIMRLPAYLRSVLIGRYCLPMDYETGRPIEPRVIAEAMHMPVRTYYRHLERARDKYLLFSVGYDVPSPRVAFVAFRPCVESTT
jgi:DNA-directed RNA polymerase specialized sigma24 family protein